MTLLGGCWRLFTPYATIPVCICEHMLMTVAEYIPDCDHDLCNCAYT